MYRKSTLSVGGIFMDRFKDAFEMTCQDDSDDESVLREQGKRINMAENEYLYRLYYRAELFRT